MKTYLKINKTARVAHHLTEYGWMYILLLLSMVPLAFSSCTNKTKEDQTVAIAPPGYQYFMLSLSVNSANQEKVKATIQQDLLPLLSNIRQVKNVKVYSTIPDATKTNYVIVLQLKDAGKKGVMLNSNGSVASVDYSQFLGSGFQDGKSYKNLLALHELVNEFEIKAYTLNSEFGLDRDVSGYAKK